MLQHEGLLATIGLDTAENEPSDFLLAGREMAVRE